MRRAALVATIVLAAVLSPAASALPGQPGAGHHPAYVPGQVIVKFRSGLAAGERRDALRDHRARVERRLPVARTVLAAVPNGARVTTAARTLERDPRVAYAEPNAYRQAGAVPNDPLFADQYALRNTGQSIVGTTGTPGADIHATQAWDRTTGSSNVKVAIIDGGINFGQPDLAPNIWHNPGESGGGRESNGVDDDHDGYVDDWHGWDFVQRDNDPSDNQGHGTFVSGIAGARGGNGIGMAGVAWHMSLIPIRVLDNTNLGDCASFAEGVAYAVRAGARVVNISIGGHVPCKPELDLIDAAPNVLFVASAMNEGVNLELTPWYPCAYPASNIVCVGATDNNDGLASFSNWSSKSVDLAAPGVHVFSDQLLFGPRESLFSDDFSEPLADRWTTGGTPDTWTRTPFAPTHSGSFALANSTTGSYSAGTDSWARLNDGLDLTGRRDCAVSVWLSLGVTPYDTSKPSDVQDLFITETSEDGADWSRRPDYQVGTGDAGYQHLVSDLSAAEGRSTGGLRFRLRTTDAGAHGAALDDVEVYCVPPKTDYTAADPEFDYGSGTSFAAPQVTGTAALILSLSPSLTAAQLKQRLLGSVDHLPSLAGKTVTGGRLNVARALQPTSITPAQGLKIDLAALARSVKQGGLRTVDRRGGFRADRLHGFGPGRFTLTVKGAYGRTLAAGSCSVAQPALCSLMAWLNARGASVVRGASRLPVTLVLSFAPRTGPVLTEHTSLTLLR
jgi:thermitase